MKNLLLIIYAVVLIHSMSYAGEFKLDKEFVEYIKKASNPSGLGMRGDGRYYPYSTPLGRRIGFRQKITDKQIYLKGISKAAAQVNLEKSIAETLRLLKEYVDREYPKTPYDTLSRKSQFILLDFAVYYTPLHISDDIYSTVIAENYDKLIDSFMYIRFIEGGWPDNDWNRAFANKWIYKTEK